MTSGQRMIKSQPSHVYVVFYLIVIIFCVSTITLEIDVFSKVNFQHKIKEKPSNSTSRYSLSFKPQTHILKPVEPSLNPLVESKIGKFKCPDLKELGSTSECPKVPKYYNHYQSSFLSISVGKNISIDSILYDLRETILAAITVRKKVAIASSYIDRKIIPLGLYIDIQTLCQFVNTEQPQNQGRRDDFSTRCTQKQIEKYLV